MSDNAEFRASGTSRVERAYRVTWALAYSFATIQLAREVVHHDFLFSASEISGCTYLLGASGTLSLALDNLRKAFRPSSESGRPKAAENRPSA